MTEEREKELAEKIHGDCMFRGAVHQCDVVQQTKLFLRTVAAEARKEGIEEMLSFEVAERLKEQGDA